MITKIINIFIPSGNVLTAGLMVTAVSTGSTLGFFFFTVDFLANSSSRRFKVSLFNQSTQEMSAILSLRFEANTSFFPQKPIILSIKDKPPQPGGGPDICRLNPYHT